MTWDVQPHFEELRQRVNAHLAAINSPVSREQAEDYPWLFGALGKVPAQVMFICETPSLTPIRRDNQRAEDEGPTGIDKQWWGGEKNPACKRFRTALCETGLKTTPRSSEGGWECYITNVIKEANIAGHQEARGSSGRLVQARRWADILTWQLCEVSPRYVFGVGGAAQTLIRELQAESRLPRFHVNEIVHYSDRGPGRTDERVTEDMVAAIRQVLG
jgi:hypothetical protein